MQVARFRHSRRTRQAERAATHRGPAISISAPRHSSAGGVSPENAAQQVLLLGATWQRSPSFFRQKPQLLRHSSDWLYQRQRVSRQMLPPIVPMLRNTGDATVFVASYRTRYSCRMSGECSMAASVVSAPILTLPSARFMNPAQLADTAQVEHVRRREELLLHRRQQIGSAGNDLHVARVLRPASAIASSSVVGRSSWKVGRLTAAPPAAAALPCWIVRMSIRTFAAIPQRAAMLAERFRLRRVDAFGHVDLLHAPLGPQRRQDALRSRTAPRAAELPQRRRSHSRSQESSQPASLRRLPLLRTGLPDRCSRQSRIQSQETRPTTDCDTPASQDSSAARLSTPSLPATPARAPSTPIRSPVPRPQPDSARVRSRVPPRSCELSPRQSLRRH